MNRTKKKKEIIERLDRLGIPAVPDESGKITLALVSQETKRNICLPLEEMEDLIDKACEIGLCSLADGVLKNIVITLYNKEYVYK